MVKLSSIEEYDLAELTLFVGKEELGSRYGYIVRIASESNQPGNHE